MDSEAFAKHRAEQRKRYQENEFYRKMVEEMIHKDPQESARSAIPVFYRMGSGMPGTKDVLFFPVRVLKGRKSFGKIQCLITPFVTGSTLLVNALGKRWVDRKFLVFKHDHEYELLENSLPEETA